MAYMPRQQDWGELGREREGVATLSGALPSVKLEDADQPGLNWQMDSQGVILLTCTMGGSAGLNDRLCLLNVFTKK